MAIQKLIKDLHKKYCGNTMEKWWYQMIIPWYFDKLKRPKVCVKVWSIKKTVLQNKLLLWSGSFNESFKNSFKQFFFFFFNQFNESFTIAFSNCAFYILCT